MDISSMWRCLIKFVRTFYFLIVLLIIAYRYLYRYLLTDIGRDIFDKSIMFSTSFGKIIILIFCFLLIFYYFGKQMKRLCAFQYITTGIVAFFASSFLFNLILCIFNISSAKLENFGLFAIALSLLLYGILTARDWKERAIYPICVLIAFILLYGMTENMVINRFPFKNEPFVDEIHNWYTMTVRYFNRGLLFSIKNHTMPGYGLFVHHVWVTIKRFTLLNMEASFYFPPRLLFLLGIGFIFEIKLPKRILFLGIIVYAFSLIADDWLRFLLVTGLYGEGLTGLFFAILLKEVLNNRDSTISQNDVRNVLSMVLFWLTAGVLYTTKPFISHICFLLPFFYVKLPIRIQKLQWLRGAVLRLIPMLMFPILWITISGINRVPSSQYPLEYYLDLYQKTDVSVIVTIINLWLPNVTSKFYMITLLGGIIGLSRFNKHIIYPCFFFILLNLLMIFGLYSTAWVDVEKGSSFRYFTETYYLCLYAFLFGFVVIYENISQNTVYLYDKIKLYSGIPGALSRLEKYVSYLNKAMLAKKEVVILVFIIFSIGNLSYYYEKRVDYIDFSFLEKWPDGSTYRWSEKEGVIDLKREGLIELKIVCSHPDVEMKPVTVVISSNEKKIDRLVFRNKKAVVKRYHVDKYSKIKIHVSRTWSPDTFGMSNDKRNLGVAVSSVKYIPNGQFEDTGLYDWERLHTYAIPKWPNDKTQRFRWTANYATVRLKKPLHDPMRVFLFCGHPDIELNPVTVTVSCKNRVIWERDFTRNEWHELIIPIRSCRSLTFTVSRTWNPQKFGISEDDRNLGVALAIPSEGLTD